MITVLSAGDVDSLDPGGHVRHLRVRAARTPLQRRLFTYGPAIARPPRPDLAEAAPEISADGRTVGVRIREGVRFSSPVDREVTAADVKYAIERAFTANVVGPYVLPYFSALVGAPFELGPYRRFSDRDAERARARVPSAEGTGAALAGALAMPISIPVPKEYATPFDAKNPSEYGRHQVFTGPYKIETDDSGTLTG